MYRPWRKHLLVFASLLLLSGLGGYVVSRKSSDGGASGKSPVSPRVLTKVAPLPVKLPASGKAGLSEAAGGEEKEWPDANGLTVSNRTRRNYVRASVLTKQVMMAREAKVNLSQGLEGLIERGLDPDLLRFEGKTEDQGWTYFPDSEGRDGHNVSEWLMLLSPQQDNGTYLAVTADGQLSPISQDQLDEVMKPGVASPQRQ